jgi:hypothetical protein
LDALDTSGADFSSMKRVVAAPRTKRPGSLSPEPHPGAPEDPYAYVGALAMLAIVEAEHRRRRSADLNAERAIETHVRQFYGKARRRRA